MEGGVIMKTKNTGAVASLGGFVPETKKEDIIDKSVAISEDELEELFAFVMPLNSCPTSH